MPLLFVFQETDPPAADHPLDSIAVGVLETRSFLFLYEESEENKENLSNKGSKVQRSHSDRATSRKIYDTQRSVNKDALNNNINSSKDMPAKAKCPKIDTKCDRPQLIKNKVRNKFFQHVNKTQDDAVVPPLQLKKKDGPRDPNAKPLRAALVNAKYVNYSRITNDLAVLFFTSADALMRRFYLIKMVECFAETLGITLTNLGIDTDKYNLNWTRFVKEFQTHVLYGFMVGVLVAMANTDVQELNEMIRASGQPTQIVDGPTVKHEDPEVNNRYTA